VKSGQGNAIRRNSIYNNADLGIRLQGNGNNRQAAPVLTAAVAGPAAVFVAGTLTSTPNTTFVIDVFANTGPAPLGTGAGRNYLGSVLVRTDARGVASFTFIGLLLPGTTTLTATATDPDGNTSEFSQRFILSSNPPSGTPNGIQTTLLGFHFLDGATASVGGVAATGVNVSNYNTMLLTVPALPPGSLNDIVVTNTDGSVGTLPNGWIADFLDVPGSQQFYNFVTTLVRNEITVGIGGGNYGVDGGTKRQQMAVFLLKAKHGVCYVPPPCAGVFPDVPCTSVFAPWIEALAAEGVTTGCGGGNFCPDNLVTRRQMAVFLLKSKYGSNYTPPDCTGVFDDVPCPSAPAVTFIEELATEQITGGCSISPPLYCPDGTSTRGQMAVFITKTFQLQ